MDKEALFRKQLEDLVKTARRQGMYLAEEQLKETFPEFAASEDKLELVRAYFKSQNIALGEENAMELVLSEDDRHFLEDYLEEIKLNATVSPEEKEEIILAAMAESEEAQARLLEIYLPDVAEIAKLYAGQGAYIEDLIGEGNVALTLVVGMLGCLETPEEADGFIGKFVMDAMEKFLQEEEDAMEADEKALEKVNTIATAAKELSEELRRKVTVAELSEETQLSEDEIREAMRISGNQIEDIEG